MTSVKNVNTISVLQKKCLRIINFAPFGSSTKELFKKDSILKVCDIIDIEKLKVAFDFKTSRLPSDLMSLFTVNSEVHSHDNRTDGFHIPTINTTTHGNKSLKYSAAVLWNVHLKLNKDISKMTSIVQFKSYAKKYHFSKY